MKRLEEMSREERVELWGFDPLVGMTCIGATESKFSYVHPHDGRTYSNERFEFFYSPKTGEIDVHHFGCNGRIFYGNEDSDGNVTFKHIPFGYPSAEEFSKEFKILRDKFLEGRRL